MNDQLKLEIAWNIAKAENSIREDPKRLEKWLSDLFPAAYDDVWIICDVQRRGIPGKLRRTADQENLLRHQCVMALTQMRVEGRYDREISIWAIETWAKVYEIAIPKDVWGEARSAAGESLQWGNGKAESRDVKTSEPVPLIRPFFLYLALGAFLLQWMTWTLLDQTEHRAARRFNLTPVNTMVAKNVPPRHASDSSRSHIMSEDLASGSRPVSTTLKFDPAEEERRLFEALRAFDDKNYRKARDSFLALASAGNAESAFQLGMMNERGIGATCAPDRAITWYTLAAEHGHIRAAGRLGALLADRIQSGEGDQAEESSKAMKWLKIAAEGEDAEARRNLAQMYIDGIGVERNSGLAIQWFRRAADQGDVRAQVNLAQMYDRGDGVPENAHLAALWYRRAAEQGDADAAYRLGLQLHEGRGVEHQPEEAKKWLRLAAQDGVPEAIDMIQEMGVEIGSNAFVPGEVTTSEKPDKLTPPDHSLPEASQTFAPEGK
ncbi:MAG: sel1 repeat family protein [Candidatus Riflebacteria bacterium]|nr:sel1 repeat family protein [Candidatus Riflebacteria bacterium]